ncbi:MAG: hypothetical protein ACYDGR_14905, partial [Candidatus Dormibacteria bacterium]
GGPRSVQRELLAASQELDQVERLIARRRRALQGLSPDEIRTLEMPLRFRAMRQVRRLRKISEEGKGL